MTNQVWGGDDGLEMPAMSATPRQRLRLSLRRVASLIVGMWWSVKRCVFEAMHTNEVRPMRLSFNDERGVSLELHRQGLLHDSLSSVRHIGWI